jgi:hypothetical protein
VDPADPDPQHCLVVVFSQGFYVLSLLIDGVICALMVKNTLAFFLSLS